MAGIDPTKVRDRWSSKLYETFQRNAENVVKEDDKPGTLGYAFPGTKFDGGKAAASKASDE